MYQCLNSGLKLIRPFAHRLLKTRFASNDAYKVPAVATPSIEELQKISDHYDMRLSNDELKGYQEAIANTVGIYNTINKLTEPHSLSVKYPRTGAYRPEPEENDYNAWYWKCDIKGAPEGKLKGKSVAIKDNICLAGVPMMNGSRYLEGYVPECDATVVTRILDAGGYIPGKSVVPDMCFSSGSFAQVTGEIDNPHKKGYSCGGSSSGSGALVAGNCVDMALGGDQVGSIRLPSSWSGIVGLKPTHGLVPYTGAVSIDNSIDHLGPMTKTVYDCALLLEVIAGNDGMDSRQPRNIEVPEYTKQLVDNLKNMKIGLLKEGFALAENEVAKLVHKAAQELKKAGAELDEVSIPMHTPGADIVTAIILEGGLDNMISGCGVGYGKREFYCTSLMNALHRGIKTHMFEAFPTLKLTVLLSQHVKNNYGNYFYGKAQNLGRKLKEKYLEALQKYDALILPTAVCKPPKFPKAGMNIPDFCAYSLVSFTNTCPFNIAGTPALTVNAGFIDDLPIGMMIVGKHFDETTVLKIGHAFEKLKK